MLQARTAISRWIGFSVLLLLSVTLQIMVFPRISILPNPMVSVAAVVCASVFAGRSGGAVCGAVCGLLCDALMPGMEAYFTVTTMAAGGVTGFLCGKYMQRAFWPAVLLGTGFICLIELFRSLFFYIAAGRAPWGALGTVALPAMLAGIACIIILYPAFRGVARIFDYGN
jgi:rod shape-determining protein MreD